MTNTKINFVIVLILILILVLVIELIFSKIKYFFANEPFDYEINPHDKTLKKVVKLSLSTELTLITSSGFITIPELNLVYFNDNFYISNQPKYIFTGILDLSNGKYRIQNTLAQLDLILKFNISNASNSKIIQSNPLDSQTNNLKFTRQNIFNTTDRRIYLDPINRVISSNDNSGNSVYLTFLFVNSPGYWNYNLENASVFNINYVN